MSKIETEALYEQLNAMAEEERIEMLDPICQAVRGKAKMPFGGEALANRIFALAVIDLYKAWQEEVWNQE